MKIPIWVLAVLMILTLPVPCRGQPQDTGTYRKAGTEYPSFRGADFYTVNGQRQSILVEDNFGAIVYMPEAEGFVRLNSTLNETFVTTKSGVVKISRDLFNYSVTYPGGAARISQDLGHLTITFNGKSLEIRSESLASIAVKFPGDTVTYDAEPNQATIRGEAGKVVYSRDMEKLDISSPAGVTRYRDNTFGSGFTLEGTPVENHPYRYWGIELLLPGRCVGILVDLSKYFSFPKLPGVLEMRRALVIEI